MKARFDHAGGSVEFDRAPGRLTGRELEVIQATAKAAAGAVYGSSPLAAELLVPLAWKSLPLADLAELETFFDRVVDGMVEEFTYTDVEGTALSVRFASPRLGIVELPGDVADVSAVLMEV